MLIKNPCIITPRLLPGIKIGDSFLSIEYAGNITGIIGTYRSNRQLYRIYLDTPTFEYETDDLASGCQGGTLQEGLESTLSFLGACGESYSYQERNGKAGEDDDSNANLFPKHVAEWCASNSDELSMLACELEETENLIEE